MAVETSCSLDAVVAAEIRNSSRPGSQAPHAPPALTFGLPGKQRVNQARTRGILIHLPRTLPRNRWDFNDQAGHPGAMAPGSALLLCAFDRQHDLIPQKVRKF